MQPGEVEKMLEVLMKAKQSKAHCEQIIEEATAALAKIAEQRQTKTLEAKVDDKNYNITVVASERVVYEEDSLRSALGERKWARITTAKIDSNKLKSEMMIGRIDPEVIGRHCQIRKSKPYVKISEGESQS